MGNLPWVLKIIIFLLLSSYIIHVIWLGRLIAIECERQLWPKSWLILSMLPVIGWFYFWNIKKITNEKFTLVFPDVITEKNEADYRNSGWILFQEQYERKNGDHQGTSLRLLSEQEYSIISYTYKPENENNLSKNNAEIVIPYPGKITELDSELFLWAKLIQKDNSWFLYNEREYTLIPIYDTVEDGYINEGSLQICKLRDVIPYKLNNRQYFVVHTTEFRIFRLPRLALFRIMPSGQISRLAAISDKPILLDEYGNTGNENLRLSIVGFKVRVEKPIKYISLLWREEYLEQGIYILPLCPGDRLEYENGSFNFVVNYDPEW